MRINMRYRPLPVVPHLVYCILVMQRADAEDHGFVRLLADSRVATSNTIELCLYLAPTQSSRTGEKISPAAIEQVEIK